MKRLLKLCIPALLLTVMILLFTGCELPDVSARHNVVFVDNGTERTVAVSEKGSGLTLPERLGYTFEGYYNEADGVCYFGKDGKLTAGVLITDGLTLTSRWNLITYHVTYHLSGGSVTTPNPTEYTIETPETTLTNPTRGVTPFLGWSGAEEGKLLTTVKIGGGKTGDLMLTANFFGDTKTLTLKVDGKTLATKTYPVGETLTKTNFPTFDAYAIGRAGFSVQTWYTDEAKKTPYVLGTLTDDLTLHGSFTYVTDAIRFYPYLDTFNTARGTLTLTLENTEMLLAWVEYVRFYDVTEKVLLTLPGKAFGQSAVNMIQEAYNTVVTATAFETSSTFVWGAENFSAYFQVSKSNRASEGKLTLDTEHVGVEPQITSLNAAAAPKTRSADFDNFPLYNLTEKIPVSDGEQLVYVLEHGYVPAPVKDSAAETLLNRAKEILREIVSNGMSVTERLRAIYEWLILNVSYDNLALQNLETLSQNNLSRQYNSWYAEGALLEGVAVCEGFSKAAVILARLEGIPMIRVSGNMHEWCKVQIDGVWYGFDATHGNLSITGKNSEVLSYTGFLFTDAYKTAKGYSTEDYPQYAANTAMCAYGALSVKGYIGTLSVTSKPEFSLLLNSLATAIGGAQETVTLEIAVPAGTDLSKWYTIHTPTPKSQVKMADSDGHDVYLLFFEPAK